MAKSYVGKKDLGELMDYVSMLGDKAVSALKSEVYEDAVKLFKESQEQVPVLSGDLRSSGTLEVDETPNSTRIEVSYNEDYAFTVHENVKQYTFKHGKLSHYLSRPFWAIFEAPGYDDDLADRVLKRAESGKLKTVARGMKGKPGPLADRSKSRHYR